MSVLHIKEIAFASLYVLQHGEIEEAAGGKSNQVDTVRLHNSLTLA